MSKENKEKVNEIIKESMERNVKEIVERTTEEYFGLPKLEDK